MNTNTLGTVIQRACRRYGDVVAIDDGSTTLTFEEVGHAMRRLAGYYRELGLRRGDRVVLQMRNSVGYLLAEFALYQAGLVKVAVNSRYTAAEAQYIALDAGAKACIFGNEYEDHANAASELSAVEHLIRPVDLDAALHDASGSLLEEVDAEPGDVALLQYSSGTTGRPKGAMYTHGARTVIDRDMFGEMPTIGVGDTMLHLTPLSHASGAVMIPLLARGVKQVPREFTGAGELIELVKIHQATMTFLVPTILNMVVAKAGGRPLEEFKDLHTVLYAGSPISPEHLHGALNVFGQRLVQFYGLTEAWLPISCLGRRDHVGASRALSSAGRAVPFVELEVRGPGGERIARNEIGEIAVRGDHVMAGYWNNHVATREVLSADGWLATGDLGYEDDHGFIHLVDRKNDMIVSGGFNVYPLEVEQTLGRHAAVAEAAVFGTPDDTWGELVTAAVVASAGSTIDIAQLEAHCRTELAAFKCPRRFEVVDELPRNSAGKLLRREVRAKHWQGRDRFIQG